MKNVEKLFAAAIAAREKAYAPYSKFPVGVAILDENGDIHQGCNIENSSFPVGCCAETVAIGHMIVSGGKEIKEVLVVADAAKCSPCGGCRQQILEFGKSDTPIHIANLNGVVESHTIGSLIPVGFRLK